MKKLAKELKFISHIKRDGTGVEPPNENLMNSNLFLNTKFKLNALSLTEKTFIASGFNSYVVRLKDEA